MGTTQGTPPSETYRTDRNNNPCAFTVTLAKQAGLVLNIDYASGDPFTAGGATYYTADLLGDPIAISIRLIDAVGYYTQAGACRWTYIALPKFVWDGLTDEGKRDVIGYHYMHEGGTALRGLFPNYGQS